MHSAYILLGSNIDPVQNVQAAIRWLRKGCQLLNFSQVWETEAYGNPTAPNFLNLIVLIETDLSIEQLKFDLLRPIENQLGRVRTDDKNASRTIDLDVVIYDGEIVEPNLWKRAFIAIPLAELEPDLINPENQTSLAQIAARLKQANKAIPRPDISIEQL